MVLPVPRRQPVQIAMERVIVRHEARAYHRLQIALERRLFFLHGRQQRPEQTVAHQLPAVGLELFQLAVTAEILLRWQPHLDLMLHGVVAQHHMIAQEVLDILHRGMRLAPVLLVFLHLPTLGRDRF